MADVDRFIDSLRPGQLDEWYAAYQLDPWDSHEDAAEMLSMINNVGWRIVAAVTKVDVSNHLTSPRDFLEPRRRSSKPGNLLSPAEAEAQAAMRYSR